VKVRVRRRALYGTVTLVVASVVLVWLKASAPEPRRVLEPVEPPPRGTLVLSREVGSLRLAVMGDVGRGDQLQYETAAELVRWHERFDFDMVLLLGDNIYGTGTTEDYRTKFELPYRPLLDRGVKFYAAPGNHDPENITSFEPFGMNGHRYYTFDRSAGPPWARQRILFMAIDTVRMDNSQLAWLEAQLRTDADWTIAFLHYPLYSSGRYWYRARRTRAALEPLFIQGGVDVAFSGHEHLYERTLPQHGIQYFTSGGGGTVRVGDLTPTGVTANGFDQDTHFMLVEIAGDKMGFQVIDRTGATVDFGTIPREADARRPTLLRR
jgi:3',5'-cyclic AMP phosphodiesterase CpdA